MFLLNSITEPHLVNPIVVPIQVLFSSFSIFLFFEKPFDRMDTKHVVRWIEPIFILIFLNDKICCSLFAARIYSFFSWIFFLWIECATLVVFEFFVWLGEKTKIDSALLLSKLYNKNNLIHKSIQFTSMNGKRW